MMAGLQMQDWKMWNGKKCGTGKCGTKLQDSKTWKKPCMGSQMVYLDAVFSL